MRHLHDVDSHVLRPLRQSLRLRQLTEVAEREQRRPAAMPRCADDVDAHRQAAVVARQGRWAGVCGVGRPERSPGRVADAPRVARGDRMHGDAFRNQVRDDRFIARFIGVGH